MTAAPDLSQLLFVPELRAMVEEGKALSRDDFRPLAVCLRKVLNTSTTSDVDKYRAPNTHKFLITQVMPHLVVTAPASEAGMIGFAGDSTVDRHAFKASNCRVLLQQEDATENILGEVNNLSLASLMPAVGGAPFDWSRMPYILGPGETAAMTVTLVTTSNANNYVGGNTEYGLVLAGFLVRVKRS